MLKWKVLLLLIIICFPLTLIFLYESYSLKRVDYSQQFQDIKNLQTLFRERITKTQMQLETIIGHIIENLSHGSQSFEKLEQLKHQLRSQRSSAFWLSHFSLYRKINILNVLICGTDYGQKRKTIEDSLKKGLEWFSQEYEMNFTVIKWSSNLLFEQLPQNSLILMTHELKYDYLQENIATKLRKGQYRNSYYLPEIVKELRSTALFSHCKFTNINCNMKTIIFTSALTKKDTYLNVENEIYFSEKYDEKMYFNILADCLGLNFLQLLKTYSKGRQQTKELYHLILKEHFFTENLRVLDYIHYTFDPIKDVESQMKKKWKESPQKLYDYLLKGKHISPYIHDPKEMELIQKTINYFSSVLKDNISSQRLQLDLMTDMRVGRMDLFPNNFKVGVYLPLLIIFGYPLGIMTKYFLAFLWSKRKKSAEIKVHSD